MKEILKRAEELIAGSAGNSSGASAEAVYPAMFLYVGKKAAGRCAAIRGYLKEKLKNGGSILHGTIGAKCPDADFSLDIGIPDNRSETVGYINDDDTRLAGFSAEVLGTVGRLMRTSGFPRTDRCFLFIITVSDCPYNAILPEFVILFSDNAHIRVNTCLLTEFSGGSEGYLSSGAFFRELEECRDPGFVYDGAVLMRDGLRIPVHWEGALYDTVVFLEMYRSDMKYSPRNAENNARIEALTAVLCDREEPVSLPKSPFCTAGISYAETPVSAIAHTIYRSLTDVLAGRNGAYEPDFPAAQLFGYEVLAGKCDSIMLELPDISNILSVLPERPGSDPDSVRNTGVRDILGYYGGADEKYFTEKYEKVFARLVDKRGADDLSDILKQYINKRTLKLNGLLGLLDHDGDIAVCLAEVTDRLDSEEQELQSRLETILAEPCGDLTHGLFSKPSGCEILASAVTRKYSKKLEILRLRMMKRIAANILEQARVLHEDVSRALNGISSFSDSLSEEIMKELYDSGSTLTETAPFMEYYAGVTENAASGFERAGGMAGVLRGRDLYSILMDCGSKGTDEFAETALDIFRGILADPSVREIFARTFDKELYERYRNYDGGKDSGWVDAQLIRKLCDESSADLRYSVFQPSNSLFIMGNRSLDFVRKMLNYDDPGFNTVHIGDVDTASYEQLAVYNVPSADSVVYVRECRRVYEAYAAGNDDRMYIRRGV